MSFARTARWVAFLVGAFIVGGGATVRATLLIPTNDNNVLKSKPDEVQPNGNTFTLKVGTSSQSNARIAFLKFDLSGLSSITDPVTFTATTSAMAGADFTLQLYGLLSGDPAGFNWTEDTLTYTNRPAPSDPLATGILVDTTKAPRLATDQTVTIANNAPAGTAASFTFSGLENLRQSDNTATLIFLISAQSSNTPSLGFNSSEATSGGPTLDVTVPEPASVGLLALGGMGALTRRRRV